MHNRRDMINSKGLFRSGAAHGTASQLCICGTSVRCSNLESYLVRASDGSEALGDLTVATFGD